MILAGSKSSSCPSHLEKLSHYYSIARSCILKHQNVISGLFPVTLQPEPNVASIRESIYASLALWSLGLAHRNVGDDGGRKYELCQSAVKCMRAILGCWMRQADKVEKFKINQTDDNSLHSTFQIQTGDDIPGRPHFVQMDCVALYLVAMAQMTSSGYKIVWSSAEASFVQNLVFYLERAYRTPDWGMWECECRLGRTTELNASTIGLAKAALESLNGFNLYGDCGSSSSVAYVDADAHQRNRSTLETILPKESISKDTDAGLLPAVLWPGYACSPELREQTVNRVTSNLAGNFGIKRFHRDGFGTYLAQSEPTQSGGKKYAGIECEWPMFWLYIVIDLMLRGQTIEARKIWGQKVEPLLALSSSLSGGESGNGVSNRIAGYFYAPGLSEVKPVSAKLPSRHVHADSPTCIWAQSLLLIAQLLLDGLLNPDDLDPMGRRSGHTTDLSKRYSTFQLRPAPALVQIIVIAESVRLQQFLATYGIVSQTPHELDPIQIWNPSVLVEAYESLGVNRRLGLSGRPARPIGTLGCSKVYRVCGRTVLCYVVRFNVADFYLFVDTEYVIDEVRADLQFLAACWHMSGRPTYCLLLREDNFKSGSAPLIFGLLSEMRRGRCSGVHVQLVRLQVALSQACVEHLDFIDEQQLANFRPFEERCFLDEMERQADDEDSGANMRHSSLTLHQFQQSADASVLGADDGGAADGILQRLKTSDLSCYRPFATYGDSDLVKMFTNSPSLTTKAFVLVEISRRFGINSDMLTPGGHVTRQHFEHLYEEAGSTKKWLVVRMCAAMLRRCVDSIAPEITNILVRGKRVGLGVFGREERIIDQPSTPTALHAIIYDLTTPSNFVEAVVQQELIVLTGRFITLFPELYDGIVVIRMGWIVHAMQLQLAREKPDGLLWALSPAQIKELYLTVLCVGQSEGERVRMRRITGGLANGDVISIEPRFSSSSDGSSVGPPPVLRDSLSAKSGRLFRIESVDKEVDVSARPSLTADTEAGNMVAHLRMISGTLNRVPTYFYSHMWEVLERSAAGIRIGGMLIPHFAILSDMTKGDANFVFFVENALSRIPHSARRTLIVEAFSVIWTVLHRNPELTPSTQEPIDIDDILLQAFEDFRSESRHRGSVISSSSMDVDANTGDVEEQWQRFYRLPQGGPRGTCSLLARALVGKLVSAGFALPPADSCNVQ